MKILPGRLFAATLLLLAYTHRAYPFVCSIECTSSILLRLMTIILLFLPNKKWEKRKKKTSFFLHAMYTQYICGKFIQSQN